MSDVYQQIHELTNQKNRLLAELQGINEAIYNADDGFIYWCVSSVSYHISIMTFHNYVAAFEHAEQYNGDNGYCPIFTNNRDIPEQHLAGGDIYYISSKEALDLYLKRNELKSHSWYKKHDNKFGIFNEDYDAQIAALGEIEEAQLLYRDIDGYCHDQYSNEPIEGDYFDDNAPNGE